jgi:hypothetical protein
MLLPEMSWANLLSFDDSGKDDLLTLQLGAVRDRRNDPIRPTSGSLLRLGCGTVDSRRLHPHDPPERQLQLLHPCELYQLHQRPPSSCL